MAVYEITSPVEALAIQGAGPTAAALGYITQSINRYLGMVSGSVSEAVRNTVVNQFNQFRQSTVGRVAQSIVDKANFFWGGGSYTARGIAGLQQADDAMIPYLMAHPYTRQLYIDGRIEGYGDRYVDYEPGVIGPDHYDYRRVMSGTVVEVEKDGKEVSTYTNYYDDLRGDEKVLTRVQKDILYTMWTPRVSGTL